MELKALQFNDPLWQNLIHYAANCSWKAGPILANQMLEGRYSTWERVFVALQDGAIIGYCTLAKTDCIPDVSYTPFIGFMFVDEVYRGQRISEQLILFALHYARSLGFSTVFLVSGEKGLYEKYGFRKVEDKKDYWGHDEQIFSIAV